jgi:phenylglyoxylate dehydrogenase gamma subunit
MYEVRFHGRGGQGAVTAAAMLAAALLEEGKYAVSIPSFGFERRGAPVVSFLRCSDREIRQLTNIYTPDCLICVDPTLAKTVDIFGGLKPGGTLVQATNKPLAEVALSPNVATVGLCDAIGIALQIFKKPITNTLMLGAFARTTGVVSLDALKRSLEDSDFRDAGLKQNLLALERGYHETAVHPDTAEGSSMSRHTSYPMFNLVQANVPDDLSPVATVMSPMLPGDWRSMRPVVDRDKCVKCAVCWLYCPVQCVEEKPAWFDFNLKTCKGCGICANECPQRAITMVPEAS